MGKVFVTALVAGLLGGGISVGGYVYYQNHNSQVQDKIENSKGTTQTSNVKVNVGTQASKAFKKIKGAVVSVTRSAAKELAEHQIRVNAVAPGMVATDRFLHSIENRFEDRLNSVGFGRYALPEDIADAISFFASDESKYITGQVLGVDGGFIL